MTAPQGTGAGHTFGASRFATLDDGRRLHYRIRGTGAPTVVFESGMGLSGSIWGLVQPAVAERATTVVYDRAGTGGSDDDGAPRTLARIVADLAQLLRAFPGPLVLVGASWGGPIIRTLAATGEFAVRGLVLVDQSDENAPEFFTPAMEKRTVQAASLTLLLARTGLYRPFSRVGRSQPPDVYADLRRNDFGVRGARTMGAEMREFLAAMRTLRERRPRLDGIETAVVSGTKAGLLERAQRPAINRAHRTTAAHLAQGRFVAAPGSGHYVMFSEPEIVVREITRMLPPRGATR
ncbi:pimeloyl-ACP methyl ester carboxylesterase [Murinocardiopsis flavida]|uniref:Pimeloyl-ACP methyl ester carboxylesterase n=1 Tax=Murinocardiopsis flavida TaxID=645275 RepID=A0A2P8DUK6_9ACTN|nr:alpha/beta hydrolase [Murinocardiopsis flavida]PSL00875.1 pimeloyl-ACP methyl ester carboxylesterase [Murinocardiopsis flavida]